MKPVAFSLALLVCITIFSIPAEAGPLPEFCVKRVCQAEGDKLGVGAESPASTQPVVNPAGGGGQTPDKYTYERRAKVPACSSNQPFTGDDELCTNAASCADPLATRYWIYEQVIDVDRTRDPEVIERPYRRLPGEPCLTADDGPSVGAVINTVRTEFVSKRPALPELVVRPAPRVLITARNSFSAGSADSVDLTDTVLGLPIVITATPRRWVWDFGDGQTVTTTSPGRPGTLEVAHAYDRVGPMNVTVTVEWTGTFRIGGIAGQYPIAGVARVPSAPMVLQVHEARTELVDR